MKKEYTIVISNNHYTRCDIEVSMDKKRVGTWVLNSHTTLKLENNFVFKDKEISVVFKPAKAKSLVETLKRSSSENLRSSRHSRSSGSIKKGERVGYQYALTSTEIDWLLTKEIVINLVVEDTSRNSLNLC